MNNDRLKFVAVEVNPQPCPEVTAREHLLGFANAFVVKEHFERWVHITIEKPSKASREMVKFPQYLDKRRCHIIEGAALFPLMLKAKYGNDRGVHFDGKDKATLLTPAEAGMFPCDAIFSIKQGKLAIFFFHEGWAWHCERP